MDRYAALGVLEDRIDVEARLREEAPAGVRRLGVATAGPVVVGLEVEVENRLAERVVHRERLAHRDDDCHAHTSRPSRPSLANTRTVTEPLLVPAESVPSASPFALVVASAPGPEREHLRAVRVADDLEADRHVREPGAAVLHARLDGRR